MKNDVTFSTNPELELAFEFVNKTNRNIFLTGKAGTGKTTFLHQVKEKSIKRTVVVAPTGVAAINAKGMTIHSFFQLPFGPFLPGVKQEVGRQQKISRKKIALIKGVDLLIIDEISMVRSDMLDAIDAVLRRYKNPFEAFGGVQLLMIGDLHQLPPVVKNAEWNLLSTYYKTPYFFGSHALQKTNPVTIQLKHIYRQSDDYFINLLNRVRDNKMDVEILEALNSRYIENFQPKEDEGYITLTSHNNAAKAINLEKLNKLNEKPHRFRAKVDGDFPPHIYPTDEVLEFKLGAQVLFVKNDISPEKLYFNGKIGKIIEIEKDMIVVKCPEDENAIRVKAVDWENMKYDLNAGTKEVEENVVGTFTQLPLKLAWAITIHKSQGLTFERAIIDANAAFAHGQVYVALSRCKSFEGIVLHSKIAYSSVKTDMVVRDYSQEANKNQPDKAQLEQAKKDYQKTLIWELFDYKVMKNILSRVERNYMEYERILTLDALIQVQNWKLKAEKILFGVAASFQHQVNTFFVEEGMPEENVKLQERIKKACGYFLDKIENELLPDLKKIPVLTDNTKVKEMTAENLKQLTKELFIKNVCLTVAKKGFSAQEYLRHKANADIDFEKSYQKKKSKSSSSTQYGIPANTPHPELYVRFSEWRDKKALELRINAYMVVTVQSIVELTQYLPTSSEALLNIKGMGKAKVAQHGAAIIELIEEYCRDKGIGNNLLTPMIPKKSAAPKLSGKPDTKKTSFDLFKLGLSVEEICAKRNLVAGTVEGHLSHYVELGEIDVYEIMPRSKVEELAVYFKQNPSVSRKDAREHFGGKFSYGELKMVIQHLKSGK